MNTRRNKVEKCPLSSITIHRYNLRSKNKLKPAIQGIHLPAELSKHVDRGIVFVESKGVLVDFIALEKAVVWLERMMFPVS